MELTKLLERVTSGFVRTRSDGKELRNGTGEMDVAVAEIALMIAAIDGVVLPEEFEAYRWITNRCAGLSDGERQKRLDDAVCKAGRLLLMAQVGAYSEADRLSVFGEMVQEALPNGFADCTKTDIRRSFVLWLAMAVSDGEYSGIERLAIGRLYEHLAPSDKFEPGFFETVERLLRNLADPEMRSEAERDLDRLVIFSADGE